MFSSKFQLIPRRLGMQSVRCVSATTAPIAKEESIESLLQFAEEVATHNKIEARTQLHRPVHHQINANAPRHYSTNVARSIPKEESIESMLQFAEEVAVHNLRIDAASNVHNLFEFAEEVASHNTRW